MSAPQLFLVNGMTCQGCVAEIRGTLEKLPGVETVDLTLEPPILELVGSESEFSKQELEQWLPKKYKVEEINNVDTPEDRLREGLVQLGSKQQVSAETALPPKNLATYWPLILVVSYILIGTVTAMVLVGNWHWAFAMRIFMGLFFVGFSFFKLLDLRGFSQAYQGYDWIAKWTPVYGWIYPFVELGLGCAYLLGFFPLLTNSITLIVMLISIGGVIETVLKKQPIRCACLGTGFNLPMSQVTIIEDGVMIVMAAAMIGWLLM